MTKKLLYEAFLYGEFVDFDEDSTDLLRRCTTKYGLDKVMSKDFKMGLEGQVISEEKQEV